MVINSSDCRERIVINSIQIVIFLHPPSFIHAS